MSEKRSACFGKAAQEGNCEAWEGVLAQLGDGTLPREEEAALRGHAAGCPGCGAALRDAEEGREWLRLLRDAPPPVPEALLGKILTKTASVNGELPVAGVLPLPHGAAGAGHTWMTAAMAVLSTALTLSLAGVHPAAVGAVVRSPAAVEGAASRQFFDAKKQAVSFYDNLRLVREVEATVHDLRRAGERIKGESLRPSVFHGLANIQVFLTKADERKYV